MKTAVVYRSKSGYTEQYAKWIAKATDADLLPAQKTNVDILHTYDTIVYGGALYASGIYGLKLITDNLERLNDKNLIVFTLGATPIRQNIYDDVKNANLNTAQQKHIRFFMLRGGFDFGRLTFIDKILMTLLKMKLKTKKHLDADERGMLNAYSHPLDFTDKKHIEPIVEAIQAFNEK